MPYQLTDLALKFPKVNFIMGHSGHTDLVRDAISSASKSDNIYLETSYLYVAIINSALEKLGEKKIIFGSDTPRSSLIMELEKFKDVPLTNNGKSLIFRENILRLLSGGGDL
jgi:predicted TIM-barrel fold metal-dependent hydrolase